MKSNRFFFADLSSLKALQTELNNHCLPGKCETFYSFNKDFDLNLHSPTFNFQSLKVHVMYALKNATQNAVMNCRDLIGGSNLTHFEYDLFSSNKIYFDLLQTQPYHWSICSSNLKSNHKSFQNASFFFKDLPIVWIFDNFDKTVVKKNFLTDKLHLSVISIERNLSAFERNWAHLSVISIVSYSMIAAYYQVILLETIIRGCSCVVPKSSEVVFF